MPGVLLADLRAGARALCRAPGFAAVAVLTLAAGIAVNAVLFSLVRGLLASPLPYREPERLVRVLSERGGATGKLSLLEIDDLNREARSFEGFASFRNTQYTITGDGAPEAVPAAINTYNLFEVLGVRTHLGQTWPASHDRSRVFEVVLGYDLWRRRFGGDPAIVGREVILDAASYTVLGVLPPGFDFPLGAGIYRRTPPGDYDSRAIREASAVARLKPGVTLEQAREELAEIARRWERLHPTTNAGLRLAAVPLREQWIGGARPYLLALLGAVALIQLIACANVAGLLLTRAVARRRELAVRAALGASRGRLVRMLLAEALLLAFAGGALGLLLAAATVGLWRRALPLALPAWMTIGIDGGVIAFTCGAALVSALAAGLVPALHAAGPAPGSTFQEAGRAGAASSACAACWSAPRWPSPWCSPRAPG